MPAHPPAAAARPFTACEAVVIGGSSGAIEALSTVMPALPADLPAAVFVVLHLPRDRRSLLAEVFGPRCALPVCDAQDQEPVQPGHVYFAPPDYHLLVDKGPRLALSLDAPLHHSRPAIDVLFESAADCYGPRLLGVLLSGANEDGARGLQAIEAAGGSVVVQDPSSAAMPAMPRAALARVARPHVLCPDAIAALLAGIQRPARP